MVVAMRVVVPMAMLVRSVSVSLVIVAFRVVVAVHVLACLVHPIEPGHVVVVVLMRGVQAHVEVTGGEPALHDATHGNLELACHRQRG